MNKEKVLKYLDSKIEMLEKEDEYNQSLDNRNVRKDRLIEGTLRELRGLRDVKAFISSGLVDND